MTTGALGELWVGERVRKCLELSQWSGDEWGGKGKIKSQDGIYFQIFASYKAHSAAAL